MNGQFSGNGLRNLLHTEPITFALEFFGTPLLMSSCKNEKQRFLISRATYTRTTVVIKVPVPRSPVVILLTCLVPRASIALTGTIFHKLIKLCYSTTQTE